MKAAVNVLSILKSPMVLLGLVSMAIFMGMPYLVDNSKSSLVDLKRAREVGELTRRGNSGPRDEEGVGGEPEEQPHEHDHGRRSVWCEQLRHGGVSSRILVKG